MTGLVFITSQKREQKRLLEKDLSGEANVYLQSKIS